MTSPNRVGITVGSLIAVWHLLWSLLVLVGWAQPIIDFIFWAHMIRPIYVVEVFNPLAATTLIVVTFIIGYAFGGAGAVIWNKVRGRPSS